MRALRHLTGSVLTPKTYLSHRISEVRRMNKAASSLPKKLGAWSPVVKEVNDLHHAFAQHDQLIINPTAIDELRFAEDERRFADGNRVPIYSGATSAYLARRWPMQRRRAQLMWVGEVINSDGTTSRIDSEHTTLLAGALQPDDSVSLSIVRSLENRVHEEVAFRDHIIVENTSNLCVYRPFFHKRTEGVEPAVNWSGGVGPEIDHWSEKFGFGQRPDARVAFVHTEDEIIARINWLKLEVNNRKFLYIADTMLRHLFKKWHVSAEESTDFFGYGKIEGVPPTSLRQKPTLVIKRKPQIAIKWIKAATTVALTHAFTRLKLDDSDAPPEEEDGAVAIPPENLALFCIKEDSRGLVTDLCGIEQDLCDFFAGKFDDVEEKRSEFWDFHDTTFERIIGMTPAEFVSQQMNYPFPTNELSLRSYAR